MTAFARRRAVTATFALLGLIPAITLPTQAQNIDAIYAAGQNRRRGRALCRRADRAVGGDGEKFEQRYPGIKFSIRGGFSNVLDKKIDAQIAADKLEVDTAILQTIPDFVRWKAEGQLLHYKPPGFDEIDRKLQGRRRRVLRRRW